MSTNNAGPGMKTVKLVVRPPELGILAITPMASGGKKRATKVGLTHYIYFGGGVRKSGGELDFRFLVTVEDGDKKQAFEQNGDQIPCVYLSSVGDVSEFETEQAVLEAWRSEEWDTGIHSEEEIAPAWKFLQAMKQSGDGLFRYYSDYILQKAAQLMQQPGADAIQVACGSAKGKDIPFHVSIPENEDFDIRKLHFLWDDDWYDCEYDFLNECGYIFELLPVLLTMVEYDGRIYPIDSGVAFRTWHPMESKLLDANLEEIQ